MTTHRRALLLRAGAAAVLVTGTLVGTAASPAFAAPTLALSTSSVNLNPGETKQLSVKLAGGKADDQKVTFEFPSINGNITATTNESGCASSGGSITCNNVDIPESDSGKTISFSITAKTPSGLQPGENKSEGGTVSVEFGPSSNFTINLKGPAQTAPATQTVQEVSGTVNDSTTGKVLKGASVAMEDGAGKSRSATTDDAGRFRFLGTETNPIAPGNISISVTMNGYDAASKDVSVQAGKSATGQRLALVPIGSTASPVVPTMEESTPAGDDTQSAAPGAANTQNASNDSGGGMSSYILIALGALLVIFGIVAIVLLLRRRGDDDDDEELDEEPAPRRGGGGQRPGYRQAQADPTMVGAMGGAPTMINRGAANDATAIVRPGRVNDYDVPPDPYGAPLPRAGSGYGAAGAAAAGAGYGAANGGGYNDEAGFAQGAPSAGAGYGPSSRPAVDPYGPEYGAGGGGGYNDQAGYGGGGQGGAYADSTQRWEPSAGNGYAGGQSGGGQGGGPGGGYGANGYGADQGANGYGGGYNGNGANGYGGDQGANGYGADQGGYGPAGAGGGYGPSAGQGGYGPGGGGDGYPSAGGGYSPSAGNGYNGQADYDGPYAGRGGYEQRGGYEPAAGYERDGYERVPEPPRAGNGYDGANGNYEQRGGYGEPQGSRGQAGGNRRSLDWLDD